MNAPDPITILNTALEGCYRIERELGAGGMATVYLAEDLKHERNVALKVLRPELAARVGSERFLAEIRTTANLQHPHILPLHDSGEADGLLFYVMPRVEGESLRDRLDREHQLPVDDAVGIATSLAEALDYAHRNGVVHRDIKPGNVLLQDGKPVLSDFGIALALGTAGGGRLTETGLSLGTPHYMAPEQATGDLKVGPAADVYALGCVLYEMLVGEPPFTGSTPQAILGRIITGETRSARRERASVPEHVDAVIAKALEKVPADRFARGGDVAVALRDPTFRHPRSAQTPSLETGRPRRGLVGVLGASTVFLALLSAWLLFWGPPRAAGPAGPERFAFEAPGANELESVGVAASDEAVVFVGAAPGGRHQLWLRPWSELTAVPIPDTEGEFVTAPSLSPDGTEVAFLRGQVLSVVPLEGGFVRALATDVTCCPRWGPDGYIYFRPLGLGIHRIPAAGGATETVIELAPGDGGYENIQLLPGGEAAVYTVRSAGSLDDYRLRAIRFETDERTELVETTAAQPILTSSGHLLFTNRRGQILAAPFDEDALTVTDAPTLLVDGVFDAPAGPMPTFSLSPSGRLVYLSALGSRVGGSEFVWLDREGTPTPVDSALVVYRLAFGWALAPDGRRIAFNNNVAGNNDVYVKDLSDGRVERITTDPGLDIRPFWTPDGQRILYFAVGLDARSDSVALVSFGIDCGAECGPADTLFRGPPAFAEGSSSPGSEWLVLRSTGSPARGRITDLYGFRPGTDLAPEPLVAEPEFIESFPALSPDGRWLAYTSNRTGRPEVYVRPFPGLGGGLGRPVSTRGGSSPPRWAEAGRELLFVNAERAVVSLPFDPETGSAGQERELFTLTDGSPTFLEVAPDGRLLMLRPLGGGDGETPQLVVVQNFLEELKRLVPN